MEDRRTNDARTNDRRMNDARTADTPPMTQRGAQTARQGTTGFSLVDRGSMSEFERRWNAVQGDFVEDPRRAVGEAGSLLAELLEQIGKNLRQRRTEMDGSRSGEPDTEGLRQELRRYRAVMQRMLGEDPMPATPRTPPRPAD